MPLTLNQQRARQVLDALDGASLLVVQGDKSSRGGVSGNQRSSAVAMHALGLTTPPMNIAILFTPAGCTATGQNASTQWTAGEGLSIVEPAAFVDVVKGATKLVGSKAELSAGVQQGAWAADLLSQLGEATIAAAGDPNPIVSAAIASNDQAALQNVLKASAVISSVFKRFTIEYFQGQMSSEAAPSQAEACAAFSDVTTSPDKIPGLEEMDPEGFEAALEASVQCAPNFDMKVNGAAKTTNPLRGPVMCVSVSSKFNGYVSHGARTVFVQPVTGEVKAAYNFLLEVHEKLVSTIKVGKPLKDVYAEVIEFAKVKNAVLAAQLGTDFGFSTGLHFLDKAGHISPRGSMNVRDGSAFAIRLTLNSVPAAASAQPAVKEEGADAPADAAAAAPPTVSLVIGDTLYVTGEKGAMLATKAKRSIDDNSFAITVKKAKDEKKYERTEPRATRGAVAAVGLNLEEDRKQTQRKILQEKRDEWVAAGCPQGVDAAAGNRPEDATAMGRLARNVLSVYPDGIPAEYNGKGIQVDRKAHALILPIGGKSVAFHIGTIQKADTAPQPNGKVGFTVTFWTTQQASVASGRHRNRQWVRELTYVHDNGATLYQVAGAIKEVQAMLKQSDSRHKEDAGLAGKVAIKMRANGPRLPEVKMRPAPPGKGVPLGTLEGHENCLRFSSPGYSLDIAYSNVKHWICQPARRDISVIIHCALKDPIKIGDKQHTQVQFYAEVIETSEAASNLRRTHDEEVADEEREAERVRNTNRQFAQFAKKVEEINPQAMKVVAPFQELEFDGVGNKRQNRFRGSETALWAVSDLPFTVISAADVEVVSLERVLPGQQTFDITFVMKNYRDTLQISTVSMEKLELIKDWCNSAKLLYFDGANNLQWTKLLKLMREDKEWEAWGPHGWATYIDPNADAEEGEEVDSDDDPDDSDFEVDSDEDSDDEEEDSHSSWASEVDSSDYASGSDDDSDFEDSEYGDSDDMSDSDSRGKRKGGRGKPAAPQRRPGQPRR